MSLKYLFGIHILQGLNFEFDNVLDNFTEVICTYVCFVYFRDILPGILFIQPRNRSFLSTANMSFVTASTSSAQKGVELNWFFEPGTQNDKDVSLSSDYFKQWAKKIRTDCSRHIVGYSDVMLRFHQVILDRNYSHADAVGGTAIEGIMNQKEETEVYSLKKGFLRIPCEKQKVKYQFDKHSAHLLDWVKSIEYSNRSDIQSLLERSNGSVKLDTTFTIAMMRYEFTNVYWVMMDLYNLYLTMSFFTKTSLKTNILIIDERPRNSLDSLYQTIFHAKQLHEYPNLTTFSDLVWMFPRFKGPMLKKQASIPLVPEFRKYVLNSFGLENNHKIKCEALNIHFVWRRNYVAHPRNPSGMVWRKIKNEDELLNATRTAYPMANIRGVQLDMLSTEEQLEFISTSDLLIGMHGAAFGFSLLLPHGTGAIEVYPQYVRANWHMEYLAKWAGVHYRSWKNKNKQLEDTKNRYTTVPADILLTLINSTIAKVCPK